MSDAAFIDDDFPEVKINCPPPPVTPRERQRLEILGKQWSVVWLPSMKKALGRTDHDQLQIEMERGHPDDRTIATLLHEVLEAINRELVLKLDHDTIERLESAWFAFFRAQHIDLEPLIREDGE